MSWKELGCWRDRMGGNLHLFGSRIKPMISHSCNLSAKHAPMSPCLSDVFLFPPLIAIKRMKQPLWRWASNSCQGTSTEARESILKTTPLHRDKGVCGKPTAPSCLSALLDGRMKRLLWHFSEYESNWHFFYTTIRYHHTLALNSFTEQSENGSQSWSGIGPNQEWTCAFWNVIILEQ